MDEAWGFHAFDSAIEFHCQVVLEAWKGIAAGLPAPDGKFEGTFPVFYHASALLTASANISKIFWPNTKTKTAEGKQAQRRGEELRTRYGLDKTSPFHFHSRKLRDHFEHVDERIDTWIKGSERHNFVCMNIMTPGAISGIDTRDFFQNYDPTRHVISFQGDELEILPLVEAARALLAKSADFQEQWFSAPRARP